MILDTPFLIALRADHAGAVALARELESAGVPTRIPTVVVQELYVGVGAGENPTENASAYESLVEHKPVVPLDENIARRAGTLEGHHLVADEKPTLGTGDAIVAATGLVANEAVVTDDEDFESVEGLRVERY
jgi:predicted nucleic acid-binding protein